MTDQYAMADSVCLCVRVLRREDGLVLKRALRFVVEGNGRCGWPKRTWNRLVDEEGWMVGLYIVDVLC